MKLNPIKEDIKFSIIIASFNTVGLLSRCVESIVKHTKNFEIIIVDNGSKDGSVGYLHDLVSNNKNVKAIFNQENLNFGPANNQGLRLAEGEYIILLNSDTVVTPEWAERLFVCLNHQPGIAMVGPVSDCSNGRQNVMPDKSLPLDSQAYLWANQHSGKYLLTGVLFGWCIMVSRSFLEAEEYLFDEKFTNSFEDNDLSLRAQLRGLQLFIDFGTFIHHEGQGSFVRNWNAEFLDKYNENGIKNQDIFYDKYKSDKKKKLIAVYRIANCEKYIAKSMEQTSKFADEIICLFARSQDKTKEIALSFPKVTAWEEWTEPEHPFDEAAERNWLLQKAIERGADWVISIDGDEIYEDKFIEMVPSLMNNPNPHVLAYWCNWRTIWDTDPDGKEWFRVDGIFGGFQNYRFFKVMPGAEIKPNHNIRNHHCGSAPIFAPENIQWINVRVKHLGYDTREQRELKHAFYLKNDPHPIVGDVGNADYHHLLDKKVEVKVWKPMNRLSIAVMLHNEEKLIYQMMANVAPIADEFVIVDTGSTDKTLDEVRRFAKHHVQPVHIFEQKFESDANGKLLNYSEARNWVKSKCKGEWILSMDADELFDPSTNGTGTIFAMLDESKDAFLFQVINYLEAPRSAKIEENKFSLSETIRLFRNIPELFYSGIVHESLEDALEARQCRGIVGNTILAPLPIHHRGYLKNKDLVREKISRYHLINEAQMKASDYTDPRPYFNMALHFLNEGDQEKAVQHYMKALELNPDFWRANQGLCYFHLDQAKKYINRAMNQIPMIYREQGQFKNVVEFLNRYEFIAQKVG